MLRYLAANPRTGKGRILEEIIFFIMYDTANRRCDFSRSFLVDCLCALCSFLKGLAAQTLSVDDPSSISSWTPKNRGDLEQPSPNHSMCITSSRSALLQTAFGTPSLLTKLQIVDFVDFVSNG